MTTIITAAQETIIQNACSILGCTKENNRCNLLQQSLKRAYTERIDSKKSKFTCLVPSGALAIACCVSK